MKKKKMSWFTFLFAVSLLSVPGLTGAAQNPWKKVQEIFGKPGTLTGNVIKIGFPRTDLHVRVGDVDVKPGLVLGSWVAFSGSGNSAMMMGDLVLLEREIEPVVDRLESGGVTITALHNHLLNETPQVMYLHYAGHGDAESLAKTLHSALAITATPLDSAATSKSTKMEGQVRFDVGAIERIFGKKGVANEGVISFAFPRAQAITEHGREVPPAMGTAISINIQDTPDGVAASGDFVLVDTEVNPVIQALRASGIRVTALHNHMLDDSPRLFFMHFWGAGPATQIVTGLRKALDLLNLKK